MVQVQHTLSLARRLGACERARLTRLVTRHIKVMRHRKTRAPHYVAAHGRKLLPVSPVGRHDAVLAVKQNVRLGEAVEKRHQFGRGNVCRHVVQWLEVRLGTQTCVPGS